MKRAFYNLIALWVMGWGSSFALARDAKVNFTMQNLEPGQADSSVSFSPNGGRFTGSCAGSVEETWSGITYYTPSNCSGTYSTYASRVGARPGFRFDSFFMFRSLINDRQISVVNSGGNCPGTSTTYNYLLLRGRNSNDFVGAMDFSSASTWAGGTLTYDNNAITGVNRFSLEGSTAISQATNGYAYQTISSNCASGAWNSQTSDFDDAPLGDFVTWLFGTNLAVSISDGSNPIMTVAVPQIPLSSDNTYWQKRNKNVYMGLMTAFTGRRTQDQNNIYFIPDSTGKVFSLSQASGTGSLNNISMRASFGTLDCSTLNSPANGFCSGTLSLVGSAQTGKAVCLFSFDTQNKDLIFCAMQNPMNKSQLITYFGGTSNISQLQVSATPVHLTQNQTSGTSTVTVTNLTSRPVTSINFDGLAADLKLAPPFTALTNSESLTGNLGAGGFISGSTCGSFIPAFSSCALQVAYAPASLRVDKQTFRLPYEKSANNIVNATGPVIGSRGLVSISISANPTYSVGDAGSVSTIATYADGTTQDISSLATIVNSNSGVIQLSNGRLTALGSGTANLVSTFSTYTSPTRTITSYLSDIVLKLDGAKYNGTSFPATGCDTTTWTNLATSNVTSTLTGFSSCSTTGWRGNGTASSPYGLEFDGYSQYVDMGNPASFPTGTGAKTLCAWAQTGADTYGVGTVLSYGKNVTRQSISIGISGGSSMASSFSDPAITARLNGRSGDWPFGAWKHICATYLNRTVKIYSNASLVTTKELTNDWNVVGSVAYVGRNVDGTGYWKGRIAQASIYNRALSQADIVGLCRSDKDRYPGIVCAPLSVLSYATTTNGLVNIEPVGGVAPYTFTILMGNGVVDSNSGLFSAANVAGTTQVAIIDSIGQSVTSNIAVGDRTNPTYRDTILSHQPLGYWRLGEATGNVAADSSGNNRNGTYVNVTKGQIGAIAGDSDQSSWFDGINSYVTTPINVSELTEGFSLESWIRTPSVSSGVGAFVGSSILGNNFRCGKESGVQTLTFSSGTFASTQTLSTWANATYAFGDNLWHHVVCVWDKANGKQFIYLDGNIVASQSVTTNNLATDYGTLTIGSFTNRFYGNLDEVAVYGRALSISEVRSHFQNRWVAGPSVLSEIILSPAKPSVIVGDPQNFVALGVYSDNSKKDITSLVKWSSKNPSVASFNANTNTANALGVGIAEVTASLDGVSASTQFIVNEPIFVRAKGFDDYVLASLVTPEGVYAGGVFTTYSSTKVSKIARFLPAQNILDTSFAIPGTGFNNGVYAIARDPSSGKVYVGGNFTTINGVSYNRIVRLNANGTPDNTFSVGTGFNNTVLALVVGTDGKLYAGGDFTTYQGTTINRLARLNSDGSLDGTFAIGSGADNSVKALALDSSSKLVVVGQFTNFDGVVVNKITRRLSTGAIDSSFVSTGVTGGNVSALIAVVIDSQDRIYGGMNSYGAEYNGRTAARGVFRALNDGSVDATYTTNINSSFGGYQYISTLGLDSSERLVVGGYFWGDGMGCLARFNGDGTRDLSFKIGMGINAPGPWTLATSGSQIYIGGLIVSFNGVGISGFGRVNSDGSADKTFMDIGSGFLRPVGPLFQDRTGKFLVSFGGGWHANGYNGVVGLSGLARLNRDGTFDESILDKLASFVSSNNFAYVSFGDDSQSRMYQVGSYNPSNGVTTGVITNRWFKDGSIDYSWTPILPTSGQMRNNAFKIDQGDLIYLGGSFTEVNGQSWNRIIRYLNDGSIDSSFQIGTGFNDTVWAIKKDEANSKIYVGGDFTSFNGVTVNRLARLNTDGTLDTTFDVGTGFNSRVVDISLSSGGKVVVSGDFTTFKGSSQNRMILLNSDGSKDISFDIGSGFNGQPTRIEVTSTGKVYAAGAFTSFNGNVRNYVLRLNSNGSLDTVFDSSNGGLNNRVNGMALDPSGDLIVGGSFYLYKDVFVDRLLRLTPTGDRR